MNISTSIEPASDIRISTREAQLDTRLKPLAAFRDDAERVEDILNELSQASGGRSARAYARLLQDLEKFEPSVTLFGQVKSGKTSLINAMTGWSDLLPADVNPWTSVVTSLHLNPAGTQIETAARFQFMAQEDWDRLLAKGGRMGEMAGRAGAESELQKIKHQIETLREKSHRRLGHKFEMLMGQSHEYGYFDKNLIERYICLGDDFDSDDEPVERGDQGRFADITSSADLYLNSDRFPIKMCLRDTPGVNDTFMMREQVTIGAMRDSKISVVVLSANQALTSVDMGLIRMLSTLTKRELIIFVNRIDDLPDPVGQIPEIEASIRKTLKKHQGPDDALIIFGSAHWANKALSSELEDLGQESSTALLDWAEVKLDVSDHKPSAQDMIWALSGVPELLGAIADRVVEDLGRPQLSRIASAAINIASNHQVAAKVIVQGERTGGHTDFHAIKTELETIAKAHLEKLDQEVDDVISAYHERADRAHATFLDRAVHSMIEHLENVGEDLHWDYDPTGLRVLVRTAYSVMATRLRSVARQRYEATVQDVAALLFDGFGPAVEGVQLYVPEVPRVASPVTLGQTIALDLNDRWWSSWWRRVRGASAFEKRFRELINAETEDFMTQIKFAQTEEARQQINDNLQAFADQQRDILFDIVQCSRSDSDVQDLFDTDSVGARQQMIEDAIEELARFVEVEEQEQ